MHDGIDVREKLMSSARTEFLQKGYEKASLRVICKNAGVTTGALYFFFRNKADLFDGVVAETARRMMELVERQNAAESGGSSNSTAYQRELNEYICRNKDEVRILLDGSSGTKYDHFADEYGKAVGRGFFAFYDKFGGTPEYRDIMKLIVRMRVQGYIEMLKGDYDMDKMIAFSALMEAYGESGFRGMMEQFNSVTKG